jgi:hypothetical protein
MKHRLIARCRLIDRRLLASSSKLPIKCCRELILKLLRLQRRQQPPTRRLLLRKHYTFTVASSVFFSWNGLSFSAGDSPSSNSENQPMFIHPGVHGRVWATSRP